MAQMVNTVLIGQHLSLVQILSPIVSSFLLAVRALNIARPPTAVGTQKNINGENEAFTLYRIIGAYTVVTVVVLTATFVFVLSAFDFTDTRAEWAKQFEVVSFEADAYV